jgi:uncharacterized membrane protein YccC
MRLSYLSAWGNPVTRSFALRLTLASALAMALASALSLTNPWWAAMAVWMVSQPTRGMLLERSLAQLVGTCVGGVVAVLLMALLSAHPTLLLTGLGLWTALCCATGNVMRHQRAYGAVLCGLTTAVIVILSLGTEIVPLDFAIARVVDGVIGIVSSILLVGLANPRSAGDALLSSARTVAAETIALAANTLGRRDALAALVIERKLLADVAALDVSSEDGAAGSLTLRRRLKCLRGLLASLLDLISISRTLRLRISDVPTGQHDQAHALAGALAQLSQAITDSIAGTMANSNETGAGPSPEVEAALAGVRHEILLLRGRDPMLAQPLAEFDEALLAALADYREMSATGARSPTGFAVFQPDFAGMRTAVLRSAIGVGLAGAIWLITGWEAARYLMLGVCAFTTLFAIADEPTLIVRRMFVGAAVGCVLATVWRLGVIPLLDNEFLSLLLAMPIILLAALMQAGRATSLTGLALNMIFAVFGQPTHVSVTRPAALLLTEVALLVGIALSYAAYRWVAPMNTAQKQRNLKVALLGELGAMAVHAGGPAARRHWAKLRALSLGLASRPGTSVETADGMLAALAVGHALLRINDILDHSPPAHAGLVFKATRAIRDPGFTPREVGRELGNAAKAIETQGQFLASDPELVRSLRDAAASIVAHQAFFSRRKI